jgi:hypothetical protein
VTAPRLMATACMPSGTTNAELGLLDWLKTAALQSTETPTRSKFTFIEPLLSK